ncbi:TetR/AcrR family transcriptional regulator [Nakamurella lactea]|uniref:TetR/AcrR family transcriptional regulator n=1 Tax=Nakamurella lactea TaxID=459515 RepID=UPI0004138178|nr:TetR/AcrR family transcriptional regulator [Nakamurella lactea]
MAGTDTRERLLAALLEIISERGLDQVSIREVAGAAGVSIGTVQYYCRSKDEMLVMAFERVVDDLVNRAKGMPKVGAVGSVLRAALLDSLPRDRVRRAEARVYLAFTARAAVSPDLAAVLHRAAARMRSILADALRLAQQRGEADQDVDAKKWAAATLALVDGLVMHMISDPTGMTAAVATAAVDAHLRSTFAG